MRWYFHPLFAGALVISLLAVSACGTAPKPDELQQLESRLQDPDSQALREIPNAARYYDEARQYRRVSAEAYEDGREGRSREYAILGNLRYRTAQAVLEKFEAAARLREVNTRIEEINPEIRDVTQSRNELSATLRDLDQQIQEAVRDRERQRQDELQASSEDFVAANRDDDSTDRELLEAANEKITRAEELRDQALENKADEYDRTRGLMNRAETQLENSRTIIQESPSAVATADRQLDFAIQLFEEALELAEPIHAEMVEKMRPSNRISTLLESSRASFSARFVERSQDGARVILARLFDSGEDEFAHGTGPMLDTITDLANEYEEFSIRIEGYTQEGGGSTQNLATSQARAHKVEQHLLDAGVDSSRIDTEGFGQEDIRFPDSAANNDRVEVIFRHTNP